MTTSTKQECAVVIGMEAAAVALRAAREGLPVHLAGADAQALDEAAARVRAQGGQAVTRRLDAADPGQLAEWFAAIAQAGHQPALVVHASPRPAAAPLLDTPVAGLEAQWRRQCYAGSLLGQAAIPRMLPAGRGTLLFLGHPAGAAAAGLRSFAQSMAREFGPKGIHVAHVVVHEQTDAGAIAETCWQLHRQHRTTWTQELDLLP